MDKIIRIKLETGDSQQRIGQLDSSMTQLGKAADTTSNNINDVAAANLNVSKTAAAVNQAVTGSTSNLGRLGKSAGQAGIQVQQLVGQVTSGTSPFVAFSQQAADLGFVLGVPLLGAVVSIAAAIGGVLVNSINKAKDAAGQLPTELEKRLEEIKKAFAETDEASRAAFAQVELGKLNTELNEITKRINTLKSAQKTYFDLAARGNNGARLDYQRVGDEIVSLQEKLKPLAALQEKVRLETLGQAQDWKEVGDEVDKTAEKTKAIADQVRIATVRLQDGDAAARRLALAMQLGLTNAEQLPEELQKSLTILEKAEQAAKGIASEFDRLKSVSSGIDKLFSGDFNLFGGNQSDSQSDEQQARINARIAALRQETATIGSELQLQQAVRDGYLSQEQASLDFQTAQKIQKAITERDLLLSEKGITDEQKLAAEIAFQENATTIANQYADARIDVARRENEAILSAQQSFANGAIQLIAAFGSKSFKVQKAAAIATSLVNITAGVAKALNNPYPANLGFAAQVAAEGAGLITAIKSVNPNGGGSVGGLSGSSANVTPPTTPQAAAQVGSFEITGLSALQEQLDRLDPDEVLPVSFTRRLVASISSVQRLEGGG